MKKFFLILLTGLSLCSTGIAQSPTFQQLMKMVDEKNYFKTKEIYDLKQNDLSLVEQQLIGIFTDNAFNRLEASNHMINLLLQSHNNFPDSILLAIYRTMEDNCSKLYRYKEAKEAAETILTSFEQLLSPDEKDEVQNNLKIWTALENEPAQEVSIPETNRLKMEKDKAGLNNLKISTENDTLNFIFDTGANLSTTSLSTAQRLHMKIIPVDIEVGTITGESVQSQLAICPLMVLGNIRIRNAVFLVLEDKALAFPQIDYQIYGILGFPVIEALREIQVTQDGYFIVPMEETQMHLPSNMAMNGLTPLIYMDGMHFTFDTGADQTLLYHAFYQENKAEIESRYQPEKASFAGAGGAKEFDGYIINRDFHVMDRQISLKDIHVIKERIKEEETVYGNIGQDLIRQFEKMTINFDRMFIKFD